jgi:hypothetical protein
MDISIPNRILVHADLNPCMLESPCIQDEKRRKKEKVKVKVKVKVKFSFRKQVIVTKFNFQINFHH